MNLITVIYIINATFLIIHEIESGYEKEWVLLKLPFKVTGFLAIHIPIVILLFAGAIGISQFDSAGFYLGIITGIAGTIPFFVHKIFINKKGHFELLISNILIYSNLVSGIFLLLLVFLKY